MTQLATSWCDGPIVAFDLETTNVDPHHDRIVTASVVTISPRPGQSPDVSSRVWLAGLGVEIPADATAVHGVSTAQARQNGRPAAEVAAEVAEYLAQVWRTLGAEAQVLRIELAEHHGRSPGTILSRLLKLRCDPELPGQTSDDQRGAELKAGYDAEYGW